VLQHHLELLGVHSRLAHNRSVAVLLVGDVPGCAVWCLHFLHLGLVFRWCDRSPLADDGWRSCSVTVPDIAAKHIAASYQHQRGVTGGHARGDPARAAGGAWAAPFSHDDATRNPARTRPAGGAGHSSHT
jgi:hypothetical protein